MESRGMPLAQSRYWRCGLRAYWQALGKLMTNVVYVKQIPPRAPQPAQRGVRQDTSDRACA